MNERERVSRLLEREFEVLRFDCFDYDALSELIIADQARGRDKRKFNNLFIMADTETSKSTEDVYKIVKGERVYKDNINYIVKWSLALNAYGLNIAVLWGDTPEELIDCMQRIQAVLPGDTTIIYFHNLSYDYIFLRKFLISAWGFPVKALNTKPHYPVELVYYNGIVLRDSLIVAQRSIQKWADDLNAPHKKAVGKWDYEKIRHQRDPLTVDELEYICNDVLAGVECLSITRGLIHKTYRGFPYTATGIPRGELREIGEKYHAHDWVKKQYEFDTYMLGQQIYHGGYTHANKWRRGDITNATCFDFSSSYPFVLLSEKFPYEKFQRMPYDPPLEWILERAEHEAFIFQCSFTRIHLKDPFFPMPVIQLSKLTFSMDAIADNGRITEAGFLSMWMNELTLKLILDIYDYEEIVITDVYFASKRYLPAWLTQYVYQLYIDKCKLKKGDPVQYSLAKAKLNSIYGMFIQKVIPPEITENAETGEYVVTETEDEEHFKAAINRRGCFLFYFVGVWVTSYAQRNLFQLGSCARGADAWLYSDTDSCYFEEYDMEKITAYNEQCKRKLIDAGFGAVHENGRDYWLGIAEPDGEYQEFRAWHSKAYACRDSETGELKITVAGVPKKPGVKCLGNDIKNFKPGFIFRGDQTGKLTHVYNYADSICVNQHGDIYADSVNLIPCDYELSPSIEKKIKQFMHGKEIDIPYYGEDAVL